jgi:hypothetical protein
MQALADPAAWAPVFAFLEHESRFQAAAAAITGAAAAWWLKALLAPPRDGNPLPHPIASKIAAGLLAVASFSFFVDQGRVAGKYGELARHVALREPVPNDLTSTLVRNVWEPSAVVTWLPYYTARGILVVVGLVVLWMLFWPDRGRVRVDMSLPRG